MFQPQPTAVRISMIARKPGAPVPPLWEGKQFQGEDPQLDVNGM